MIELAPTQERRPPDQVPAPSSKPTAHAERGLVFFTRWEGRIERPIGVSGWCARQWADGYDRDHDPTDVNTARFPRYARDLRAAADVADAQIDAEILEPSL